MSPMRIALYSHETVGLGHLRRNLLIAQALTGAQAGAQVLVVSGVAEANFFPRSQGIDYLTLPTLCKAEDGSYSPRFLGLGLDELLAIRSGAVQAALEAYAPDVLIVDKVPRGVGRELDPTLAMLRRAGRTRCVLGLRDVLDDPVVVRREWMRLANADAVQDYYDAIWVYGDREVYDVAEEYAFPASVARKLRYTGYFDRSVGHESARAEGRHWAIERLAPPAPFVLCLVGGGEDGTQLAEDFAHAARPAGLHGVILTGPFMPAEARRRLHVRAVEDTSLHVIDFVAEPTVLLRRAQRVVAMGGYNTLSEVLSFEKPALVVPRVKPRREQLLRAERFRELGLVDVCHPAELTPGVLADWLAKEPRSPHTVRARIDLGGLERLPGLLEELSRQPASRSHPAGGVRTCESATS